MSWQRSMLERWPDRWRERSKRWLGWTEFLTARITSEPLSLEKHEPSTRQRGKGALFSECTPLVLQKSLTLSALSERRYFDINEEALNSK